MQHDPILTKLNVLCARDLTLARAAAGRVLRMGVAINPEKPQNLGFNCQRINTSPRPTETAFDIERAEEQRRQSTPFPRTPTRASPESAALPSPRRGPDSDLIVWVDKQHYVDAHVPSGAQASKARSAASNDSDLSKLLLAASVIDSRLDQATKIR